MVLLNRYSIFHLTFGLLNLAAFFEGENRQRTKQHSRLTIQIFFTIILALTVLYTVYMISPKISINVVYNNSHESRCHPPNLFTEMFHDRKMNSTPKLLQYQSYQAGINLHRTALNSCRSMCFAVKPCASNESGQLLVITKWYNQKFNQVLCTQAACAGTGISSPESSKGPLPLQARLQLQQHIYPRIWQSIYTRCTQ